MGYAESGWERVMRVQQVMMRALSGEIHWFRAAAILGVDVRTMRRWRETFEHRGCHALFDRRPSMPRPPRRSPPGAPPSAPARQSTCHPVESDTESGSAYTPPIGRSAGHKPAPNDGPAIPRPGAANPRCCLGASAHAGRKR